MKELGVEFEALCRRCVEEDKVDTHNEPFEMCNDEDNEDTVYYITPKGALWLTLDEFYLTDGEFEEVWEKFSSLLTNAGWKFSEAKEVSEC